MTMSKLEAVNQLLDAIGEDPVSSLASGLDDAETAERFLDRTSKECQSYGWHVNTDLNLQLVPTTNNEIELPANTLKVDTVGTSKLLDVVARRKNQSDNNKRLFDRKAQSFALSEPVYVNIVYFLPFEDLTYALQNYITALAAERFQQGELGSITMDEFSSRQGGTAWINLLIEESENTDGNVLTDNASSVAITRRKNRIWGI